MKKLLVLATLAVFAALACGPASALDLTLTPSGIALKASGSLGVELKYPELDNARRTKVEIVNDSAAQITYSTGAVVDLKVGKDGSISLTASKLSGAESGISHSFAFGAQSAAGKFQYSTDDGVRKTVPAEKAADGFVFRGDNKRFELTDGGAGGFVITLPYGYQEFKDFRIWNNNQTFDWKSHSHFPSDSFYTYNVAASDGSPVKIQKPKVDLSKVDRYVPYPPANDESQWPGKGVIRTFGWQTGIRENYFKNRSRDLNAIVLVGDSLTENFRDVQKRFPKLKIANRGVGGDTSRGILFRFPIEVIALKPQAIVILAGANDLTAHGDPEHAISNIREMVALSRAYDRRTPLILCTIPQSSQPDAPLKPGARERVNEGIKQIAAEDNSIIILDLDAAFQNLDGTQNLDYFAKDRLHLGPKGYDKWTELLTPLLQNAPGRDSPANPEKIDLSKFKLVWSDEFDGSELNPKFWDVPTMDRQGASRWHKRNITVSDGTVKFAIKKTGDPTYRYESAGIRTSKGYDPSQYLYAYQYGYIEASCRMHKEVRSDYWAALWLMAGDMVHGRNTDTRVGTEIDVYESFNLWNRGEMGHNIHWGGYNKLHDAAGFKSGQHRELLNDEFHTYGLYWDEDIYIFYIDGVEVARTDAQGLGSGKDGKGKSQGTTRAPAYIKLSVEAAPWCGPSHEWEKDMPEEDLFEVDYVRVYQKK
jgi:Lysophospholipase L1 and related esterases